MAVFSYTLGFPKLLPHESLLDLGRDFCVSHRGVTPLHSRRFARHHPPAAACLMEELTGISQQLADAVDENWVAWWEKMMAGKLVEFPNLQN
jgi:hypothetical protein